LLGEAGARYMTNSFCSGRVILQPGVGVAGGIPVGAPGGVGGSLGGSRISIGRPFSAAFAAHTPLATPVFATGTLASCPAPGARRGHRAVSDLTPGSGSRGPGDAPPAFAPPIVPVLP